MKKIIIGIFAHPDDESFGPSGYLYNSVLEGSDVHLLLVTKGDAGTNCDDCEDLSQVRINEWKKSGELIGARSMVLLDRNDGTLNNNQYLEIAHDLQHQIDTITASYSEKFELELLTFEKSGISGHLDHIAVSFITSYLYKKLIDDPDRPFSLGKLKYFTVCDSNAPEANTNWLFMPKGASHGDIDETIDISNVYEKKLEIMRAHKSQRRDMNSILERVENSVCQKREHFIYYK